MFEYLMRYDFLKLVDIVYYVKMLIKYDNIDFLVSEANAKSISNYHIAQEVYRKIKELSNQEGTDQTLVCLDELNQLVIGKMNQRRVSKLRVEKLLRSMDKRVAYQSPSITKKRKLARLISKKVKPASSEKQRYLLSSK